MNADTLGMTVRKTAHTSLSNAQLRERLSFAMDGVILSMPPSGRIDRWNHCEFGEAHIWGQKSEAMSPALAGNDLHGEQVPLPRAVPLWGGVSAGGFAILLFHQGKKLSTPEWVRAVSAGKRRKAITSLSPVKPTRASCEPRRPSKLTVTRG